MSLPRFKADRYQEVQQYKCADVKLKRTAPESNVVCSLPVGGRKGVSELKALCVTLNTSSL